MCRRCFQIEATSEEAPSTAGICVEQRRIEIARILKYLLSTYYDPGALLDIWVFPLMEKIIETPALMGLTFRAVELHCLKNLLKDLTASQCLLEEEPH